MNLSIVAISCIFIVIFSLLYLKEKKAALSNIKEINFLKKSQQKQTFENQRLLKRFKDIYENKRKHTDDVLKNTVEAMAVTTNHEIRQPLMVLMGSLELLRMNMKIDQLNESDQKLFLKMNIAALKIDKILMKYKKAENYTIEEYTNKSNMIIFNEFEKFQEIDRIEKLIQNFEKELEING